MFVSFVNVIRRKWNGALNRLSRRLLLSRVPGLPREVQIVPTNACNLSCRACPKTHYPTDNRHLSPEVYGRVKRELFPAARILNLQGLGEPLLAPLFRQMVKDARAFGLKIKFVTNAMRLDEDIMREIVMAGADVTVSLDGARAETHEDSRTGSEFSVVIDALSKFHALQKKIHNPDFHISINTVVTKRNVEEIEDIIEVSAKYGVSALTLISPGVGERKDDYAQDVISRHPELLLSRMERLIRRAQEKGIALFHPVFARPSLTQLQVGQTGCGMDGSKYERLSGSRLFPGACLDPWWLTYIDVDGWVRPCCRAIWVGMGNILEKPFRKIWNDMHYVRLRRFVNSNNPPEFCRGCTNWWGITQGDELYMESLKARGIALPPPPEIGVMASSEKVHGA